jgi:hypothetical protein
MFLYGGEEISIAKVSLLKTGLEAHVKYVRWRAELLTFRISDLAYSKTFTPQRSAVHTVDVDRMDVQVWGTFSTSECHLVKALVRGSKVFPQPLIWYTE